MHLSYESLLYVRQRNMLLSSSRHFWFYCDYGKGCLSFYSTLLTIESSFSPHTFTLIGILRTARGEETARAVIVIFRPSMADLCIVRSTKWKCVYSSKREDSQYQHPAFV